MADLAKQLARATTISRAFGLFMNAKTQEMAEASGLSIESVRAAWSGDRQPKANTVDRIVEGEKVLVRRRVREALESLERAGMGREERIRVVQDMVEEVRLVGMIEVVGWRNNWEATALAAGAAVAGGEEPQRAQSAQSGRKDGSDGKNGTDGTDGEEMTEEEFLRMDEDTTERFEAYREERERAGKLPESHDVVEPAAADLKSVEGWSR